RARAARAKGRRHAGIGLALRIARAAGAVDPAFCGKGGSMSSRCERGLLGGLGTASASLLLLCPSAARADAAAAIDKGDTAWVLVCSALVLLMTAPGLALFYGGMVRQKNALATLMQSFVVLCLVSIQWVLFGYSLAFGPDKAGILGGLQFAGLRGVGAAPN